MNNGTVRLAVDGAIASVVFDRPAARNAMTWTMYQELAAICEQVGNDPAVRVVCLRGAGGEAFVAGTDIEQFKDFDGAKGLAYERNIDAGMARLESLAVPTVAVIEGWCVGGGLAIATACDIRIATPSARLGVPIAKTLGNCLSSANIARRTARPASRFVPSRRSFRALEPESANTRPRVSMKRCTSFSSSGTR